MKQLIAIVALSFGVLAAQTAHAETVYLECTLAEASGQGLIHLDLTLNEEAGSAGFVIKETGWSPQKMTAAFTPRDVTFSTPLSARLAATMSNQYRIDRTDLSFSEENRVGDKSFWRRGKCALAPKIERKF